jgi:uncharacterized protein (DUF885 family)
MRLLTRVVFAACGAIAACTSVRSAPTSVAARVAVQNALFAEAYESDLKAHPERATSYGDYRFNDRLDEYSLAAIKDQHGRDQDFLVRLQAISTTGFAAQDALSHEVLVRTLEQRIRNYDFKEFEMPVSQMDGPHVHLADLPPRRSVRYAEAV